MDSLGAALSATTIVIVGLLVTALVPLRHENRRWLLQREQARCEAQVDCCAHFLDLASRAFDLARASAARNRNLMLALEVVSREAAQDRQKCESLLREARLELRAPLSTIRLICRPEVVEAADCVCEALGDAAELVYAPRWDMDAWNARADAFDDLRQGFVVEARAQAAVASGSALNGRRTPSTV